MRREFISNGFEHEVYKGKKGDFVLKQPTFLFRTLLVLHRMDAATMRKEYEDARELIADTTIVIPRTHIIKAQKGYIVGQPFIHNDSSVNIQEYLQKQHIEKKFKGYDVKPSNFVPNNNVVFWVDPNRGYHRFPLFRTYEAALHAVVKSANRIVPRRVLKK